MAVQTLTQLHLSSFLKLYNKKFEQKYLYVSPRTDQPW